MSNTVRELRKRKLKKTGLILLGLYIMFQTALFFIQEKILFRPKMLAPDYLYKFSCSFEEVFLKAKDGAVINAIHFKTEKPKGIILYFHGNAGDLSRWGSIAEYFAKQDYDVFIMDYRTYGKSTGKLSENTLYEDAQLCYEHLLNHYNASEITLYGRSLGTGIATYVASKNSPKQLILETPYYSMVDVAKFLFPLLPVKYFLKYRFPTYEFIKNVQCSITIFHGTDDSIVPYSSGKKLFDGLPKNQAKFFKIESAGHNNLIEFEEYRNGIENLLK